VIVPPQATAPALVLVGVLMMQGLGRVDLTDLANAVPIALTLLLTVLTNNLINGMAMGTLSLILILLATRRAREISGIVWGLGAVFLAFFYVTTMLM
jgi:AGZA family xanthine/uracil permease-like MFS transporter